MIVPTSSLFFWLIWGVCFFLSGCSQSSPPFAGTLSATVTLLADGENRTLTTTASTVRELLIEAGIELSQTDEVTPPLFTPLANEMNIVVVRVTESTVVIERSVPFSRQIVRSESMTPEDAPIIVQGGKAGLEELTVRIVYRDGLETERRVTQITVVEATQDEIVMVGIGAAVGNVQFAGTLAYISSGNSIIIRGQTAFPEQLNTNSDLDGRVFRLSPTGSHLLYTRTTTETTSFNSLWVISTERNAQPRSLDIKNVLWADWNPARLELPQIAFSTAEATDLPPGWEANNDLWIGDILQDPEKRFAPEQIIEAYPATYGWWGGNYAWSPNGRYMAFGYADEVGILDLEAEEDTEQRLRLQKFVEFNTHSDWAWVPSLSWSPDSQFLIFSNHGGIDASAGIFDNWAANITSRLTARFRPQVGMWSHPLWSHGNLIAYLQANNPLDSERSSYTLWLMDQDGSNAHQLYPAPGENSRFPADQQFMAWGPTQRDLAFVFDDDLYLYNLNADEVYRLTQDDSLNSHPTWAPYGLALTDNYRPTELSPFPTPFSREEVLPEE